MLTKEYLKNKKYSVKRAAMILSQYMDAEFTDGFYHRIYDIVNGNAQARPDEHDAIKAFMESEAEPHNAGIYAYKMRKIPFPVLERYLMSGIFNTNKVKALFRRIKAIK